MVREIDTDTIASIAQKAGEAVMKIYAKDIEVDYKNDTSPLTEADTRSNKIICSALQKLYPHIPVMSEENRQVGFDIRKNWEYYWCIDPLDGTKEFIKKNGEFTVNIALIYKHIPVLGIVYAPAIGEMYVAKQGEGAFKLVFNDRLSVVSKTRLPIPQKRNELIVVASKSHLTKETQEFIDKLKANSQQRLTTVSKGSSLKLCMVAEGSADIYPRLAPTMEWDTAAADAIVRESGKMVYNYISNKPLDYNKKELQNPWFIVK